MITPQHVLKKGNLTSIVWKWSTYYNFDTFYDNVICPTRRVNQRRTGNGGRRHSRRLEGRNCRHPRSFKGLRRLSWDLANLDASPMTDNSFPYATCVSCTQKSKGKTLRDIPVIAVTFPDTGHPSFSPASRDNECGRTGGPEFPSINVSGHTSYNNNETFLVYHSHSFRRLCSPCIRF